MLGGEGPLDVFGTTAAAFVPGVLVSRGLAQHTLESASLRGFKARLEGGVFVSGMPRFLEAHSVDVVVAQVGEQGPVGIHASDVDARNVEI